MPAPARDEAMTVADMASLANVEQLERHAFDLGRNLQEQQRELDLREAEFHAHLGEAEHELRLARLTTNERAAELAEREAELESVELEAEAILARAMSTDGQAATAEHFSTVDTQGYSQELKLAVESWRKRLREVEASERHLQSQISQLGFDRRQMADQQQDREQTYAETMQRIEAERADERARFERQLKQLAERDEELDRRAIAVDQLHNDVSRMYREAIELRLATEQQWAEMAESGSETELTKRRAELRSKLIQQFQLSEQRVQDERREIAAMLADLEQHRVNIEQQRNEVREWVVERNAEIERDAKRVMEREHELNRQLSEHRFLEQQWVERQAGFEQEIRRLRRLVKSD